MSVPNITEDECLDGSPEAEDNRINGNILKKQTKETSRRIPKLVERVKKLFFRQSSSDSDNQSSINSSLQWSSFKAASQHPSAIVPNLEDEDRENMEKSDVARSASSLSANDEKAQCDSFDLGEDIIFDFDCSLSDLIEKFTNYTVGDIKKELLLEKADGLDSELDNIFPKCSDVTDRHFFDNDSFATYEDSMTVHGGKEQMLGAPNCDDKQDDKTSEPCSRKEENCGNSKMSAGNKQQPETSTEPPSQDEHHRPESDLDQSAQDCNNSVECSQRKESLTSLATVRESIPKIALPESLLTTDDMQPTKLCPAAVQLPNICDYSTGQQKPTSSALHFKMQEKQDMDEGSKVVNDQPYQDADIHAAHSAGLRPTHSHFRRDHDGRQNLSDRFMKQDQDSHDTRKLISCSENCSSDPKQMGDVKGGRSRCHGGYDPMIGDRMSKQQCGIHGEPELVSQIAVPMRFSSGLPVEQLNQPTSSRCEIADIEPHLVQTSNGLAPAKEPVLPREDDERSLFEPIQDLAQSAIDCTEHLVEYEVTGIAPSKDFQHSNFAIKSDVTYKGEPEFETKRALPIRRSSISSVSFHEAMSNDKIAPIEKEALPQSADHLALKLRGASQECDKNDGTLMNPVQLGKQHSGSGARRKERTHMLPTKGQTFQGGHSDVSNTKLSTTQGQNTSNKADLRSGLMESSYIRDSNRSNPNTSMETSALPMMSLMQSPALPPSNLNLSLNLTATKAEAKKGHFNVDNPKASPGMDDGDQNNLGIYSGTNNGVELRSPMNDRFHKVGNKATSNVHSLLANVDDSVQKQSHLGPNIGTLLAIQLTSSSDKQSNQSLNPEPIFSHCQVADTEPHMELKSNALVPIKEPVMSQDVERSLNDPTQGIAGSAIVCTAPCESIPQSTPIDYDITVNLQGFSYGMAMTQQDEAIDQNNSATEVSLIPSNSTQANCEETAIMSTSGMSNSGDVPSTSPCRITLDASHEESCEPDHRSKRKCIIPNDSESSQRFFTPDLESSTSQNPEVTRSIKDENQLRCEVPAALSENSSSSSAAEFAQCLSDIEQINVCNDVASFEIRCTGESVPVTTGPFREVELANRIKPRCCVQCKGPVVLLVEENQRQICEDCMRSNKRRLRRIPGARSSPEFGICCSCATLVMKRRWIQCQMCSKKFCQQACLDGHVNLRRCLPKAFSEQLDNLGPEDSSI